MTPQRALHVLRHLRVQSYEASHFRGFQLHYSITSAEICDALGLAIEAYCEKLGPEVANGNVEHNAAIRSMLVEIENRRRAGEDLADAVRNVLGPRLLKRGRGNAVRDRTDHSDGAE